MRGRCRAGQDGRASFIQREIKTIELNCISVLSPNVTRLMHNDSLAVRIDRSMRTTAQYGRGIGEIADSQIGFIRISYNFVNK